MIEDNIFIDVIIKNTPKILFNALWLILWASLTPTGAKKTVSGNIIKKAIRFT